MKGLNDYINIKQNNNLCENYLLERLCTHCSLEFKLMNGKGLDPRFKFYQSIYESLGKFDNAGKVVEHIIKELQNNFTSQKIDCKNDKVYFDFIDITLYNNNYGGAAYLKYKDDTIYIEIYSKNLNEFNDHLENYERLILHELLHGYEDYNRIKFGKESIFDLYNNDYKNAFKNLNNIDDIKMYFSRCKYFLNTQERNAYFSSLENSIKKLLKTNNYYLDKFDYNKFINDLKEIDTWKIYFGLFIFIEKLKQYQDKNVQKYIEDSYNKLYTPKTYKEICKELTYKWKKFDSKFNQLVPKILCNNLTIKESRNYSFFVDKLNKSFEL